MQNEFAYKNKWKIQAQEHTLQVAHLEKDPQLQSLATNQNRLRVKIKFQAQVHMK